ncbi:hypothetical protein ACH4SP_33950 [Streptomyces sp. NPDC021093]|uniref:hypothetical protein n=1 Tax=Streptomyces sp. NPDC021093 TaxID=3365112 RepID=UPI0037B1E1A5
MKADVAIGQLEQALNRLAWGADQQLEHLGRWGVGPDELALEFDDAFRVVPGLVSQGLLPDSVTALLQPVDDALAAMTDASGNEWTNDAMAQSPTWSLLRRTAQEALDGLRAATDGLDP